MIYYKLLNNVKNNQLKLFLLSILIVGLITFFIGGLYMWFGYIYYPKVEILALHLTRASKFYALFFFILLFSKLFSSNRISDLFKIIFSSFFIISDIFRIIYTTTGNPGYLSNSNIWFLSHFIILLCILFALSSNKFIFFISKYFNRVVFIIYNYFPIILLLFIILINEYTLFYYFRDDFVLTEKKKINYLVI